MHIVATLETDVLTSGLASKVNHGGWSWTNKTGGIEKPVLRFARPSQTEGESNDSLVVWAILNTHLVFPRS